MPIKLITIDFWNTLYDSSNGAARMQAREHMVRQQLQRLGYTVSDEVLKTSTDAAWELFNAFWRKEQHTPLTRVLVEHVWKCLECSPDEEALEHVTHSFTEGVLHYPPVLLPGVRETLDKLSREYRLALISDTAFSPGSVLMRLMERDDILRYFCSFSFSDETGVAKPHPKAFAIAIQETAHPQECIHIGDIEATDIIGAKNFGMKAIRFTGDTTSVQDNGHDQPTMADAEAKTWEEVLRAVDYISLRTS